MATTPWGHSVTTTLTHLPTATGRLPAHRFAIPLAALHHTLTLLLPTTTMDIPTLAGLATPPMFIWAIVLPFKLHRLHHNHHQPGWHWWEIFISLFPFYESLLLKQLNQYLIPMPKTNTRPPGTGIQTESGLYIYILRSLSSAVQLCLELILWCCQKFKQSVVSILHINEMITQQLSTCRMLCSFSFSNTLIILFCVEFTNPLWSNFYTVIPRNELMVWPSQGTPGGK